MQELPENLILVETSIFGKPSVPTYQKRINRVLMVSEWLSQKNPWPGRKAHTVYLPILIPQHQNDLRDSLGIKKTEKVVGRISRPGMDSGAEVLEIFQKIATACRLLVLGGGEALKTAAAQDPRIIFLPATTDENLISQFYNTLDVLLHYRKEGETFGMSIADAMIHGKPVVSHDSFLDNAQVELIDPQSARPCGFVVKENDFSDHAEKIRV